MAVTLFDAARACLDAAIARGQGRADRRHAAAHFARGDARDRRRRAARRDPIRMPGRPPRPQLVHPRDLPQRGFGSAEGRAAFIHAIAHIEFNAIDLALGRGLSLPRHAARRSTRDWVGVADDEARHFAHAARAPARTRPRLRRFRRAQRPVGNGGEDRARRPGAHGAGAARAGGARPGRHAGHDRQAARAGRRRDRRHPRA